MQELKNTVKNFIISSILFMLFTAVLCGIFIAEHNTEKMLFG